MRHHNSLFHDLLKLVPWPIFEALVEEHGSDHNVRRLTTKQQFIALLYGQFAGATSLREIADGLESHRARLYHVGGAVTKRSTLSDANNRRSSEVFSGVFSTMVERLGRGLRRKVGEATYLLDSTSLRLSGIGTEWAAFSAGVHGAKAHVLYDVEAGRPVYSVVTPARVNDVTVAKDMPIEAGATYVFDLGYYDYAWWATLAAQGCRIVTRFKKNTPLLDASELPVEEGGDILSDRVGHLPERLARNRRNPFQDPVREVRVRIETGKVLRVLSNDLDASAQEIADLYKRRWQIELFFRWVKQTLKIKHFLGRSENAVRTQIAVALIAYLLVQAALKTQSAVETPLALLRLIRTNLLHRKRLDRLLDPPINRFADPRQMEIAWC